MQVPVDPDTALRLIAQRREVVTAQYERVEAEAAQLAEAHTGWRRWLFSCPGEALLDSDRCWHLRYKLNALSRWTDVAQAHKRSGITLLLPYEVWSSLQACTEVPR